MARLVHLEIGVWTEKAWVGPEHVEAQDVGEGRFIITCPPRFAYGFAVGDEVELDSSTPARVRVTRHGGNLTIWVYCPTDQAVSPLAAHARTALPAIAGVLEGTPKQMLIITVPLSSGWAAIQRTMDALVARSPGASWEYANVYDVKDGVTPLDWWKSAPG